MTDPVSPVSATDEYHSARILELANLRSNEEGSTYYPVPGSGNADGVGLKEDSDGGTGAAQTEQRKYIVEACYLAAASILGTLLRVVLAQTFFEDCEDAIVPGWINSGSPICVTEDGEIIHHGGVAFADLLPNILGSFLLGVMQDSQSLGLAVRAPIAWLAPDKLFQGMDVFHLAIMTGFCGSLTTYSSWNSEMVVMLAGEGASQIPHQMGRGIFGYVIGFQTALASFVFGRIVAWWLHKLINPRLAEEAEAMKLRRSHGIYINKELPDFERKYLPALRLDGVEDSGVPTITFLEQWRSSTREARRLESDKLDTLNEIENAIFVEQKPFSAGIEYVCRKNRWDVDSLKEWVKGRRKLEESPSTPYGHDPLGLFSTRVAKSPDPKKFKLYSVGVAGGILGVIMLTLFILLIFPRSETDRIRTIRTVAYSLIFAAPGSLLRWQLSKYNGLIAPDSISWFPLGTLISNALGSLVSISMVAIEVRVSPYAGFWAMATIRAFRVGFAGCLTTVAAFVAEVHDLGNETHARGFQYAVITMLITAVTSIAWYCVLGYFLW